MTRPTAMPRDPKPVLTPTLRFPEFRGSAGWDVKPASAIAEVLQGYGFPDRHQGKQSGELPFYKVSDISRALDAGSHFIDKAANYIDHETLLELKAKTLPLGTTIFAKIGEALRLNKRAITTRACVIDNNTAGVKAIAGQATDSFLFYLWSNVSLDDYAGGVVPAVNKSTIEAIPVSVPVLAEQQKIAECLSTLDELIGAESQKLDALKAHKKGLMQQLFPREGETLPCLRFPEFHSAPEWEEKPLGQVVRSIKTGKLDANAMVEDGEYRFYTCAKNHYWIDRYAFDGEALLIAGNGAHLGYIHHYIGKFNAYQRTYVLQDIQINVIYLKYFLERNLPAHIRLEKKDGNTPYIVLATITKMALLLPSEAEQHRIATCLSSLDELIAAQSDRLAALQTHKQGLLQQLFPSPQEIR